MTGRFYRVKCKCGNEQNLFSHATSVVKCNKCKEPLAHPRGGEAVLHGEVVKELD